LRVGIYARTSRQEGDDDGSIPVQVADCRERAEEEGWDVLDMYVDPGISGWRRRVRPEYERLYTDAEAGRIDAVLCRDYERLLRNDKEGARWLDLHESSGFRHFKFADEGDIDLGRARDRKDWKERVASAVYYSDRLSEKIKKTKRRQIVDGQYTGGEREPFGFHRSGAGELDVEPSESATLHDAVSRLARGETATRICREWNAAGAQTSRGARWRPQTLRRTLLSDHLTGARGYPRLLSDEEAAVARSALASEDRRAGRPSGRRAPLVGFVYCGECGGKMMTGGGAYRCSVSHGGCGGTSVKMEPLNEYVVIRAAKRWKPRGRRQAPETKETRALIEELRRLETRSDEIADGLASGSLTVGMAGEATKRVEQRRRELTEQLSHALPAPRTRPSIQPGDLEAAVAAWQSLALEGVAVVRDVLSQVLDRVVVYRREQRGRGFDAARVKLEWK
jgi:site-specific DNA recombinase